MVRQAHHERFFYNFEEDPIIELALLLIIFLSSFFIQSSSECRILNKHFMKFNIASLIFNGSLILLGNSIRKKGHRIIECNPIEKFEALKALCASNFSRKTYFKLMENQSNEEKLKEVTYYIGSKTKDFGEGLIIAGCLYSLITLAVNQMD